MAQSLNIRQALERIVELRDDLAIKGHSLGLKYNGVDIIPEYIEGGSRLTLEQVYNAFNTIALVDVTSDDDYNAESEKIEISVDKKFAAGYYPNEFTVAVAGGTVGDQIDKLLESLASSDQVLSTGSTLEKVNGTWTKVNGSIPEIKIANVLKDATVSTEVKGEGEDAKSINVYSKSIEVKVSTNSETGDSSITLDTIELEPGYYEGKIKITPVVKIDEADAETVINVTNKTATSAGTINPGPGYDYLTSVEVPESKRTISTSISGNVVTLTESGNAGWSNKAVFDEASEISTSELDGVQTITITIPTVTVGDSVKASVVGKDTDNNPDTPENLYVSIPAGYYADSTEIPVQVTVGSGDEATTSDVVINPSNSGDVTVTDGTATVGINAGLYTTNTNITIATAGEQTLKVEDGKAVITTASSGWIQQGSVALETEDFVAISDTLIDTGSTITDPDTQEVTTIPVGSDSVKDDDSNSAKEVDSTGQVLFTYTSNLDDMTSGIQIKTPSGNSRYFASAKVDLSDLINEIDNI